MEGKKVGASRKRGHMLMIVEPIALSESSSTGKRSKGNTDKVGENQEHKVLSSEEAVEAGSLHRHEK